MPEAILFKTCLGLNNSKATSTQKTDWKTGETQLVGCVNMTTTDDGAVEKAPSFTPLFTHSAPVTRVSAASRTLFGDGVDTYELVGSSAVKRFPLVAGAIMHTLQDTRVVGGAKVYKSADPAGAMAEVVVGTNPGPATSVAHAAMPTFTHGFIAGGRACILSGNFLRYSEPFYYDLWDLGNGFIPHPHACLQGGYVDGCLVVTHAEGVSIYVGDDMARSGLNKRFYGCSYLPGSLYSGDLLKAATRGHMFLCDDGVYTVDSSGEVSRVSQDFSEVASVCGTVVGSTVVAGKYLVYGTVGAVEYDIKSSKVMLRASGVAGVSRRGMDAIFARGAEVSTYTEADESTLCGFTLPFGTLGSEGRKVFDSLYFTGESTGELEITLLDQSQEEPERWTIGVEDLGVVQQRRIKLPKAGVGSKTAFRLASTGRLRVEELRVTFSAGARR